MAALLGTSSGPRHQIHAAELASSLSATPRDEVESQFLISVDHLPLRWEHLGIIHFN